MPVCSEVHAMRVCTAASAINGTKLHSEASSPHIKSDLRGVPSAAGGRRSAGSAGRPCGPNARSPDAHRDSIELCSAPGRRASAGIGRGERSCIAGHALTAHGSLAGPPLAAISQGTSLGGCHSKASAFQRAQPTGGAQHANLSLPCGQSNTNRPISCGPSPSWSPRVRSATPAASAAWSRARPPLARRFLAPAPQP